MASLMKAANFKRNFSTMAKLVGVQNTFNKFLVPSPTCLQRTYCATDRSRQKVPILQLPVPEHEKNLLHEIEFDRALVNPFVESHLFGLDDLQAKAKDFIVALSKKNESIAEGAADALAKIIENIYGAFAKGKGDDHSAWVVMRGWTRNPHFDVPRWHIDSPIFGKDYKKVTWIIKGEPTMFAKLSGADREIDVTIREPSKWLKADERSDEEREQHRLKMAEMIGPIDGPDVVRPMNGQAVVFSVGEHGAIHTEPKIDGDRLFLSVLPAPRDEIKKLQEFHRVKEGLQECLYSKMFDYYSM